MDPLPAAMIYVAKTAVITGDVSIGAVVTEGKDIPKDSIVLGVPAKIVRRSEEFHRLRIEASWRAYVELARKSLPPQRELTGDPAKRIAIEGVEGLEGMF